MAYKINGTTVVDNSRNVCACCVTSCCITASTRLDAPSGTTANRPGSPATGSLYFDTDEGSLLSYDGASWAAVGGGSDPVSFCGMTACSMESCCIETLCPSNIFGIYQQSIPLSSNFYWVAYIPAATGTFSTNCIPLLGVGYCKPFHVSSDGTVILAGLGYSSGNGGYAPQAYTSIAAKNGGATYTVLSGTTNKLYVNATCCCVACSCICRMWGGYVNNDRHIPMIGYSGHTDSCYKGYLGHYDCSGTEGYTNCGWVIPYPSVYNSICPVYKMCGGTSWAKRSVNNFSCAKATKVFCALDETLGFSCFVTAECVKGPNNGMFCEGTGFGCGCCICCPGWTDTEMGISHPCGFVFMMTRDATDLRYYPSSGTTRSSLDGGTCGRLQGLFTISCCTSSCPCIKNNHSGCAFELPHLCAGAAFMRMPTNAQECMHYIVTWNYCTCCTKIHCIPCCQNTQCRTPWYNHCACGFVSWQKDPVDDNIYYNLTFENQENGGSRCLFLCATKFDFSNECPCYVCEFCFRVCHCFACCGVITSVPVYYDLETCGMVSFYMHGSNYCCRSTLGWGWIVEKMDFTNCTYQFIDYSCMNSYNTRGFLGRCTCNPNGPSFCGMCTACDYSKFGFGLSPNGKFGVMIWGGPDNSNLSGARPNFEWMVCCCCARSIRICCYQLERSALACNCCLTNPVCYRPFTCTPVCVYNECDRSCTLPLSCNGTGIICRCSAKFWLGPRDPADFCCGAATCAANTYNQWPVLEDNNYTMGDVIKDYETRKGPSYACLGFSSPGYTCGE